jgi:hypothetical protein
MLTHLESAWKSGFSRKCGAAEADCDRLGAIMTRFDTLFARELAACRSSGHQCDELESSSHECGGNGARSVKPSALANRSDTPWWQ